VADAEAADVAEWDVVLVVDVEEVVVMGRRETFSRSQLASHSPPPVVPQRYPKRESAASINRIQTFLLPCHTSLAY
jgi:hypothetical protein